METVLEIKNLSVSFDTKKGEVEAVRDVSFSVKKGEVLAIVGESVCSKTASTKLQNQKRSDSGGRHRYHELQRKRDAALERNYAVNGIPGSNDDIESDDTGWSTDYRSNFTA